MDVVVMRAGEGGAFSQPERVARPAEGGIEPMQHGFQRSLDLARECCRPRVAEGVLQVIEPAQRVEGSIQDVGGRMRGEVIVERARRTPWMRVNLEWRQCPRPEDVRELADPATEHDAASNPSVIPTLLFRRGTE